MEFREYAGWMVAMAIVKIVPVGDEVPTTGSPDGQRSVNYLQPKVGSAVMLFSVLWPVNFAALAAREGL